MIKVLHVFDTLDRGGAESLIMSIYQVIDRDRISFDFVIHTQEDCDYLKDVKILGGKVYRAPRFKGINLIEYLKWWRRFLSQYGNDYKVMHCHMRSTASLYIPIAKKNGIKTIAHSHSISNGNGIGAIIKDLLQYPLRYQADYLFSCSQKSGEWMFGRRAATKANHFVFRNAVDISKFQYSERDRINERKRLSIPLNAYVVCHIGNFTEAKNHEFIIEIFYKLLKRRDAFLLLVGGGKQENVNRIKRLVDCEHIRSKVIFAGVRDDIPMVLNASDIFVFPSKWEGFGMAALEAQAAGLPTIVSDNIPKEIEVTELVHTLSIDKGAEPWVDQILKLKQERKDVSEQIISSGYELKSNANWLAEFYEKC